MFNFLKRKKSSTTELKDGLSKTRHSILDGVADLFLGKKEIDAELLEELETRLLMADVGAATTAELMENLTQAVKRKELDDIAKLFEALQKLLLEIIQPCSQPLLIPAETKPYVILMVGVNGSGKTTTIGKLAKQLQQGGKSVMLAAGDTFRAAAVEQLQTWGQRNDIPVIAQQSGADSAAVIYDALQAAKARGIDVLIADTAGRLHTQTNLMAELQKIKRVITKLDPTAPHETMLVLDAGLGQNALKQAQEFNNAINISGITLTKLDGTAKGGIIFAITKSLGIPIRFIGIGEHIDDLRVFDGTEFVKALFANSE